MPDELRCRYYDCREQHPEAREDEQITCPTCREELGLPAIEITTPRRIAWGATLRRWLSWALLCALVSVADAKPKSPPERDKSAELARKRQAERRQREREKRIQECIDDRDTDPDADREICEDQVGDL